jgi:hypothetical protein
MPPSSNLVDFNGGFSYIISSWLTEEGQKSTDMASYIMTSCLTSANIHWCFLVVAFYNILSAPQYRRVLVGIANKIALARVPPAC